MRALISKLAVPLRRHIPRDSWLHRILRRISRRFVLNNDPAELLVREFAREKRDVFFIQVGSNDGVKFDPLRDCILKHSWSGIMMEPVPYVFRKLKQNYGQLKNITLVNAAIANRNGTLPFFHIPESKPSPGLSDFYDALGSFKKEVILKHGFLVPNIEERIVETNVNCTTFPSLLHDNGISQIDLLHVDTEGYDYEVLKQVNWKQLGVSLVMYEHAHLTHGDRLQCEQMLKSNGFDLFSTDRDTVALQIRMVSSRLKKLFTRLKAQHHHSENEG